MSLISPGIETKESSIQSTVVLNSTGRAALVGKFQWGPAYQSTQITSAVDLVNIFGEPNDETADYFISAQNFLNYGNDLRVARVVDLDTARNASGLTNNINCTITNAGSNYAVNDQVRVKYQGNVIESGGVVTAVDNDGKILSFFIPSAKTVAYATSIGQYPSLGSSWSVDVVSASSGVSAAITINNIITDSGVTLTDVSTASSSITNANFLKLVSQYNIPAICAIYPGELGSDLQLEIVSYKDFQKGITSLNIYPDGGTQASTTKSTFGYGPQNSNQYAIIVRRSGVVVESAILSTLKGDKDVYGNTIYIDDYFSNGSSSYIYATSQNWPVGFSGVINLGGGVAGNDSVTAGDFMQGWDLFSDRESLRVQMLIAGAVAGEGVEMASTVQKYASAIADSRQDCVALISPPREIIVNIPLTTAVENLVAWRTATGAYQDNNMNVSSSYTFIDGNYKYQYDKYNDVNRWVPLAGDMAALFVNTDNVSYTWMSPAGYNRGQISNVIKLAIEPRQAHRDSMYENGVNPVIGQSGSGFILFGDKMSITTPTPFNRVNVRRLSIMLKNDIGDSSKYQLFEINNAFTRSQFRTEVAQYMDGIKSLGGVYDYRVICDTTNNTAAVIDADQFIATIYFKPARSINFITLNMVATSTGADFDELIGTSSSSS